MAASPSLSEEVQLRRFVLPGLFVLALFITLWVRRPDPEPPTWRFSGSAFGTTYAVQVVPGASAEPSEAIERAIADKIETVNTHMSTYHSDSELSTLNRSDALSDSPLSAGLTEVLKEALRIHALSGGAFDVTIGPLVNAWGFGPEVVTPPSEEALKAARAKVGSDKLSLDEQAETLTRKQQGLYIDLSAIAKGYAVDIIGEAIEGLGYSRYLVEIGGEVRARGDNAKGRPWSVGVERPDGGVQDVSESVPLPNLSIATSGNYRNVRLVDGKAVTHILDARTGEPVSHGLGSVSVLHPSCMSADGLATALYVLGPEEGLALAKRHDIAALFLVPKRGEEEAKRLTSPAFDRLTTSKSRPQ